MEIQSIMIGSYPCWNLITAHTENKYQISSPLELAWIILRYLLMVWAKTGFNGLVLLLGLIWFSGKSGVRCLPAWFGLV